MSASFTKSNTPVRRYSSPPRSPPSPCSAYSTSTTFFHRSTSPTYANGQCSSSSVNGCISSKSSISVTVAGTGEVVKRLSHRKKRTCMCSPSTHPGSFRCSLHKNSGSPVAHPPKSLNTQRSAMTNSLVRIRGVEEELIRRALVAPIRCSSHKQRGRFDFRPRPSRFSVISRYKS